MQTEVIVGLIAAGTTLVSGAAAGAVKLVLNGTAKRTTDILEKVNGLHDSLEGHKDETARNFEKIQSDLKKTDVKVATIWGNMARARDIKPED